MQDIISLIGLAKEPYVFREPANRSTPYLALGRTQDDDIRCGIVGGVVSDVEDIIHVADEYVRILMHYMCTYTLSFSSSCRHYSCCR